MKIMIVEDHADMRRVLKNILSISTTDPIEFIECESGEDAVGEYAVQQPDCVLMDIHLKHMDGFETTSKISSYDSNAKIIFVSSHDSLKYRKQAEKLNACGFVSKDRLTDIYPIIKNNSPITGKS